MSIAMLLLTIWALSAIAMTIVWAICMRVTNVGYVDVAWAGLMAVAALLVGALAEGAEMPRGLVALFGGLWGTRLCLHLLSRVLHESEDGRYQALRERWQGSRGKFFVFFQMQAAVIVLFSLPFVAAASRHDNTMRGWTLAAIGAWLVSVGGESLADRQLAKFRADPSNRGQTCRAGLWGWSRHPNYFFEWLHWFSYVFLAVGSHLFWLSLTGPVVMFAFLYRVSGIPWVEAQSLRSRGENYAKYQRQVSAFFPWPPGRSPSGSEARDGRESPPRND
jgi:steroid 5-alpha reductase family enzyme